MTKVQALRQRQEDAEVSHLLVTGGDARIRSEADGLNQYGCEALPDPQVMAFGSSTASTISEPAHAAAQRLALRLAADKRPEGEVARREFDRLRRELTGLCGLADLDPDVVFAASGTDIHLLVAGILGGHGSPPLSIVITGAPETGSGVPAALGLRHFSTISASGESVTPGSHLAGSNSPEILEVAIRDAHGALRPAEAVDAEAGAYVRRAAAAGRKVLLILVDVSKTGVIAPSPAYARRLKQEMPDALEVLVDACQFRLSGASLRAYLKSEFLVAVTGSKFLSGPSFSGALFVPRQAARRLRGQEIAAGAALYGARGEWPQSWTAAGQLPDTLNRGLLLRWEAALTELRRFHMLPQSDVAAFFRRFAEAVQGRLSADPVFEPLPSAALDGRLGAGEDWDQVPTIFPFGLRHSAPWTFRPLLTPEEVSRTHRLLRTNMIEPFRDRRLSGLHVEVGQPVLCGERDGIPLSALRICASARLAVRALSSEAAAEQVIRDAMLALDKTAMIAKAISRQSI